MKPHLIIKRYKPIPGHIPYWENILENKEDAVTSSTPRLDRLLKQENSLSFWLTHNFQPSGANWSMEEISSGLDRIYRLILKRNTKIPKELIQKIRLLPEVESVRAGLVTSTRIPEKRFVHSHSLTPRYRPDHTYLREAHRFTFGDPRIKIAILDTGFETDHPEIRHAMLPGKDFVDIIDGADQFIGDFLDADNIPEDAVGHGTHVAGIAGARGIHMPIGVAPACKIIPIRVLGALRRGPGVVGAGLIDNINSGIKWAVDRGADIINMSLGVKRTSDELPHEEVVKYALKKGCTIVAASGNDGSQDQYYPGALPGVLAVGAADDQDGVASFSTFGNHVSIIAPGMNIYSSFLNDGYAVSSGTSQATPFVSGAVALIKSYALSRGRKLSDPQIKYLLKHTSDKVSNRFKDLKAGFGRINLLDALKLCEYKM